MEFISSNGLVGTFVKKHLKIEKDLENRIAELEEELKKIKDSSDSEADYFLYKDILKLIVKNLKFEYDGENGGYNIKIDPPLHIQNEYIEELIKDIKKYKEREIN